MFKKQVRYGMPVHLKSSDAPDTTSTTAKMVQQTFWQARDLSNEA